MVIAPPVFKTTPYEHQLRDYERFKDEEFFGLLYEQRCGKTKVALDITAHKFRRGEIDSLLVIAPNGVHYQWIQDAIPEHLPDDVAARCFLWRSGHQHRVYAKKQLAELLVYQKGLRVLAVNVDAILTTDLRAYLTEFFRGHRVMTVVDESCDIANRTAKRTEMALKIGRRSRVRVILDGTPVAAGPLGLFSQCDFLSPDALGFRSFYAFQARYAELETRDVGDRTKNCPDCLGEPPGSEKRPVATRDGVCKRCWGSGLVGKQQIKTVKRYMNVEELQGTLAAFSSRVLRTDCQDLPPKVFQKIYFELAGEERRVYDDLREKFQAQLKSGGIVTADMVLTRYLRLQQVSSGYLPIEAAATECTACHGTDPECEICEGIGYVVSELEQVSEVVGKSRRQAFSDAVKNLPGQGIVWCKFDHDVDSVMAEAARLDKTVGRYDGHVKGNDRAETVRNFQAKKLDWFVSKPRAGGRGLELSTADWICYYSHDWSLRFRLQSEDRAQSLKKKTGVLYLDLSAVDTVDDKIIAALREGKNLSDLITGDRPEKWL